MGERELSLKEEISLYASSNLTPTELFVLRLLYLAKDGDSEYLIDYLSSVSNGKDLFRAVLESLVDKKVISSKFNVPKEGESLNFRTIPYNKNFIKKFLKESHESGKEFFDNYPPFINIRGKMCSIKNITKAGLFSVDDFCVYYNKAIKASKTAHEDIMELLEFGKENNLINYSINNSRLL